MADAAWNVVAASVAGVSHIKTGLPCQDAHAYRLLPNGLLVAAVADGAGSASCSEIGAQIAVAVGVETLAGAFAGISFDEGTSGRGSLMREAMQAARTAVEAEANRRDVSARELATTLLLMAASSTEIIAVQVGDGAIVGLDAAGKIFAVTTPPEAEYANSTTFLTSPDALDTMQEAQISRSMRALALFTDGLQRLALKLPDGTPHTPFFTPIFQFAAQMGTQPVDNGEGMRQLEAFLRSPRITERADDDLTLLLAAR